MAQQWFDVSKDGLAQVLGRQSKGRSIAELISNAWDEPGVTRVTVTLSPIASRPQTEVIVEDDAPNGFADLSDAYTLFASSRKKQSAELRGRFCVGDKLFLARCTEAEVISTTGRVVFGQGGRVRSKERTEVGTRLVAIMPMTRDELDEAVAFLRRLVPPCGIRTTLVVAGGHETLEAPRAVATVKATLATELGGDDGALRRSTRVTKVRLYMSDCPMLYELGIPVVEIDGPVSIDVQQKIPLTIDREGVSPAFLRSAHAIALDALHAQLTVAEASADWVTRALSEAAPAAVASVMDKRFGPKRVSYDPSDAEANKRAMSDGYTVVTGGALPGAAWANVRAAGAILPAGRVTPTKVPLFSPDGEDVTIPYAAWTPAMKATVEHLKAIGSALLAGRTGLTIRLVSRTTPRSIGAFYSEGGFLTFNVGSLGKAWFERGENGLMAEHITLLIHELGHEWSGDHLSAEYHDALCRLGARLAVLMAANAGLRRSLHRPGA